MTRKARLTIAFLTIVFSGIVGVIILMVRVDHHSVALKWTPPPPVSGATAAAYNIYRGTHPGGPYEKIAFSAGSPNYTDRDVSSRKTYYYVVRTVDAAGRESLPSNELSAAIP
jgi:fibronectin type 3 domain-containing protein